MVQAKKTDEPPKVFISYSRRDRVTVEKLRDALIPAGFEAYLDLHDILPGEPWQDRLGKLISRADSVIFALSPDSVGSDVVDWEVNEAERLAKRVLPVVLRDARPDKVPGRVKRLNYIFMRDQSEWNGGFVKLKTALLTDIDWIREHTRLGELARRWQDRGRPNHLLIAGRDIEEAEKWALARPSDAPVATDLHSAFIASSRQVATSRQRLWVAGALMVALLSIGSAAIAAWQRMEAVKERDRATAAEVKVRSERDRAVRSQFLSLSANARIGAAKNSAEESEKAALLLIEALDAIAAAPGALTDKNARSKVERRLIDLVGVGDHGTDINLAPVPQDRTVQKVMFDKAGHRLIGQLDKSIVIWNAVDGSVLAIHDLPFAGHTEVTLSPAGRHIGVANSHGQEKQSSVMLLDAETGQRIALAGEGRFAERPTVAFSENGKRMLVTDTSAHVFEVASGKRLVSGINLYVSPYSPRSISSDGGQLIGVTDGEDKTLKVRIVDVDSSKEIRSATFKALFVEAQFAPDGQSQILSVTEDAITISSLDGADPVTVNLQRASPFSYIASARLSPSGRHLLLPTAQNTIVLVDALTGRIVETVRRDAHPLAVSARPFSQDGSILYLGTSILDETSVWRSDTGEQIGTFYEMLSPTLDKVIQISRRTVDEEYGGEVDEPALFDTRSGKMFALPKMAQAVVANSEGTEAIVVMDGDKVVRLQRITLFEDSVATFSKKAVKRCLTTIERQEAFLDPEPPDWCISLSKPPYDRPLWKEWLAQRRNGGSRPPPIDAK